jgi:hypothetical protein
LLTEENLYRIISSINLRALFFAKVVIRFFSNVQAQETLDMIRQEESKLFGDEEAVDDAVKGVDYLNRRRERKQ